MPGTDQTPFQEHFNDNEFGLNPPNISEIITPDFSKTFAYNFGRDVANKIWRALRSDNNGNLKVTNGGQGDNPPLVFTFTTAPASALALPANPLRRAFAILNDQKGTGTGGAINIIYPNTGTSGLLFIPPGFGYIDDTWQGNVFAKQSGVAQLFTIIEYY